MKREIKFRGLRTDGKGWVYGHYYEYNNKSYIGLQDLSDNAETGYNHEITSETLGQLTGLKDKNGIYIYEGDIIETNGSMSFSNYDSDKGSKRLILRNECGFVGVRINSSFDKENPSSAYIWSNYQLWNIKKSLIIISNIHES